MYLDEEGIITIVLIVVVAILVFLALREFWCWYFKINKIVRIQEEQKDVMVDMRRMMKAALLKDGTITAEELDHARAQELDNLRTMLTSGKITPKEHERRKRELLK